MSPIANLADIEMIEELIKWLVPVLAVYGAGLSTYNTLSARRQKTLAETRMLRVTVSRGFLVYDDPIDRGDLMIVTATNVGQRTVIAKSIELELPNGHHYTKVERGPHDSHLPATLKDGESASVYHSLPQIQQALYRQYGREEPVTLVPVCTDSVGNRHAGDKIKVRPREEPTR